MFKKMLICGLSLLSFACFQDQEDKSTPQNSSDQSSSMGVLSSSSSLVLSSSNIRPVNSGEFLRVGYWPYYRKAPTDSQLQYFSHIMVFAMLPSYDGELDSMYANGKVIGDFITRAKAKNIKVGLSVGGYNQSMDFEPMAGDSLLREKFAQKLVQYSVQMGFDGIDLDWEYPDTTQGQAEHYRDLLYTIRKYSKPKGLFLSANVHRVTKHFANLNPDSLDWIQIMSYDQSKGVKNGFVSKGENGNYQESLEQLEFWMSGCGFPASKIVLGLPAYGVTLKDGRPMYIKEYAKLPAMPFDADSITLKSKDGDVSKDTTYYLNGPGSVQKKVKHLYSGGYKGYMFWEVGQDRADSLSLFWNAFKALP